jgi:hypothetical protein
MNPHKQWLCEYERYDGADGSLGDESIEKIIGRVKVELKLMDGRIITLLIVFHIWILAIYFIFLIKMDDVGVGAIFEKETYKIV